MSTEQKFEIAFRKIEQIGKERNQLIEDLSYQAKRLPVFNPSRNRNRAIRMNEIIASYENRSVNA